MPIIYLVILNIFILLSACSSETPKTVPPLPENVKWLNQATNFQFSPANKFTLLEFFTDHCDACIELSTNLQPIQKYFSNQISFIGIYTPSQTLTSQEKQNLLKTLHVNYPVINDSDAKLFNLYQLDGWPTLILTNAEHKIIMHVTSAQSTPFLFQAIHKELLR